MDKIDFEKGIANISELDPIKVFMFIYNFSLPFGNGAYDPNHKIDFDYEKDYYRAKKIIEESKNYWIDVRNKKFTLNIDYVYGRAIKITFKDNFNTLNFITRYREGLYGREVTKDVILKLFQTFE